MIWLNFYKLCVVINGSASHNTGFHEASVKRPDVNEKVELGPHLVIACDIPELAEHFITGRRNGQPSEHIVASVQ